MICELAPSTAMVRARWPKGVCTFEGGLHALVNGAAAVICGRCGQFIVYEECGEYQQWARYLFHWIAQVERAN